MNYSLITGVPGVGKSTLCQEVASRNDFYRLNFGKFMGSYLGNDVDSALWEYMRSLDKPILLESHGYSKKNEIESYIPFAGLQENKPTSLILVEANTDKVLHRRSQDPKKRISETAEEVRRHMEIMRYELIAQSVRLEVPSYIVRNDDFGKGVDDLEKVLGFTFL